MTFDETIAALRAGKCVSRPNENSYLVIEGKSLTKRYKDEPCLFLRGEIIPCGITELTGADIGYEVYRPQAVVSDKDKAFINEVCHKVCDASRGESISSLSVKKAEGDIHDYLYLSVSGGAGNEWRIQVPESVKLLWVIRGLAYRPDEIVVEGEVNERKGIH